MNQREANALEQEQIYQSKIRNDAIGLATKSDGYTRFKKFTPVDQSVIDEYNDTYLNTGIPREINLSEEPILEELPLARDYGVLSKAETDEFDADIRRKNLLIEELNQMISSRDPSKRFDFSDELVGVPSLFLLKQGIDTDYNLERIDFAEYTNDTGELDDIQAEIEDEIARLEQEVGVDQALLSQTRERISEFESKLSQAKDINKAKVENYRQALELENRGMFRDTQQPGETEEEYLQRLRQVGETEPTVVLDIAERYALKNFKIKLKELIRDPVKIEQVTNSIDIKDKVKLLKIWPKIKKSFIERFGYDNFSLSAQDIIGELELFLTNDEERKTGAQAKALTGEIDKILRVTEELRNPLPNSEIRAIQMFRSQGIPDSSTKENYHLFKQEDDCTLVMWRDGHFESKVYITITESDDDGTKYVLSSPTDEEGTYVQVFPKKITQEATTYEVLASELGMSAKNFMQLLASSSNAVLPINLLYDAIVKRFDLVPMDWSTITVSTITSNTGREETIVGWGLHTEEIPKLIKFGEIQILGRKLFYDNELSVRNKSGTATIPFFKKVKVSDKFAKLVMKLTEPGSKDITIHEIDKLPVGEDALFSELIHIAKLHKKIPRPTSMGSGLGEKKRYKLLVGEIHAGNNNPELVEELYRCLKKLITLGEMTKPEARKIMASL